MSKQFARVSFRWSVYPTLLLESHSAPTSPWAKRLSDTSQASVMMPTKCNMSSPHQSRDDVDKAVQVSPMPAPSDRSQQYIITVIAATGWIDLTSAPRWLHQPRALLCTKLLPHCFHSPLLPPSGTMTTPSERRAMLLKALDYAHEAVNLDTTKDGRGAVVAYRKCTALLDEVIVAAAPLDEKSTTKQSLSDVRHWVGVATFQSSGALDADECCIPARPICQACGEVNAEIQNLASIHRGRVECLTLDFVSSPKCEMLFNSPAMIYLPSPNL